MGLKLPVSEVISTAMNQYLNYFFGYCIFVPGRKFIECPAMQALIISGQATDETTCFIAKRRQQEHDKSSFS